MAESTSQKQIGSRGVRWPPLPFILVFLSCLFFFLPLVALIAIVIYGLSLRKLSIPLLTVLISMMSVYLGLINITKVPENDLVAYLWWLTLARESGFIEFISSGPREPGYVLYMYLLANVPWSNDGLFIFVSTALPYGIVLATLARFGFKLNLPDHVIIGVLILVAFFPPLFNNSAHLMRQFLAGAFIAWFYIDDALGSRHRWWILLLAVLSHTSAVIFLPLAVAGSIRRFSPGILLMLVAFVLSTSLILLKFLGHYLTSIPYLGDIIQRLLAGIYIEHAPLGTAPLLLLGVMLSLSFYGLCVGIRSRQTDTGIVAYNLYISTFFLCLFILWAHIIGETMLAVRFLLYVYFLIGPVFLLTLAGLPHKKVFTSAVLATIPVYFFYTIVNGVWTYGGDGIWTSFATLIYRNFN